ncbi:MAG: adenosine kinase, partial [Desulfobacterales bacterium]|nr:adenosine kinase [Desulfobacterales bacterium]
MSGFQLTEGRKTIVAIGSALVDILARENDDFIEKTGSPKGSMTLVDKEFIERTLEKVGGEPDVVPGGSACNTALGVGKLGGPARFVGKCGAGRMGAIFKSGLESHGVDPALFQSESATGRVLSVITPDAQRTMFTFLGASAEARPEEMARANFQDAAIVHIEGYLLFNPDLIRSALSTAKASGARISLDLASFNVVEEARELLDDLVKEY